MPVSRKKKVAGGLKKCEERSKTETDGGGKRKSPRLARSRKKSETQTVKSCTDREFV